jgi:hypothetical protein
MAVMAGSWLIASVCIERIQQMSSAHAQVQGSSSADPHAAFAVLLANFEFRRGDREARLAAGHGGEPLALADAVGQVLVVPLPASSACSRTESICDGPPTMWR